MAAHAAPRKVNAFQDGWKKEFFATGYFLEERDYGTKGFNFFKKLEDNKVLSTTSELGLLSALEKSGLSLSKIEELGLLSTAEKLGALSLLEKAVNTDGGAIASASLVPLILTIAILSVFPADNTVETVLKFGSAGLSLGAFGALFLGGQFLKALQDSPSPN